MHLLRQMSKPEYVAWLANVVPSYAADKVALDRWSKEEAVQRATEEYEQLLPRGLETEGNYFFSILENSGVVVGSLWFVEAERIGYKVAYLFDISIKPAHRRQGHATRALEALEQEATRRGLAGVALAVFGHNSSARSLYSRLGYSPTNLNLYKSLLTSAASDA